ncbi:MAG: NADH-quinone oxidoreductase subunit H [Candidatus Melainabacteria bacterium]|nr:NADH-quinone oxidoreductase subunit H [Candidatus Melainabacteria bacterium]
MNNTSWLAYIALTAAIVVVPPLLIGFIRKTKARLQNRVGAPYHQPLLDLIKLLSKGELVSEHASWVLRGAAIANVSIALLLAVTSPWIPGMPRPFDVDIFLFIYLFALMRFFSVLSALDTASPFGGFAAGRDLTLAVLVEPAVMLCLTALAVVAQTANLSEIFSFTGKALSVQAGLWVMAGCGLYLSSLVELSRMPADDPTTHLELTMVHEAMILENSGPNLALTEYATALKLLVLMGVSGQCFLHAFAAVWQTSPSMQTACGAGAVLLAVAVTALIEATGVKLRWTKLPEFIAYAITFGLLCLVVALGVVK